MIIFILLIKGHFGEGFISSVRNKDWVKAKPRKETIALLKLRLTPAEGNI